MIFVESAESRGGIVLRNPANKRTKNHARLVCADDEQLQKVMEKYRLHLLDKQVVAARINAN
jgi:hypothetical protein